MFTDVLFEFFFFPLVFMGQFKIFHHHHLLLDTEPPVIDRCRSPPTVQATDVETAVKWEVPQFSDNSGMSGCRPQTVDGLLYCSTPPPPTTVPLLFH